MDRRKRGALRWGAASSALVLSLSGLGAAASAQSTASAQVGASAQVKGPAPMWFDRQNCEKDSARSYHPKDEEKNSIGTYALDLTETHKLTRGKKATIALIDTGIATNNNNLNPALIGASFGQGVDLTGGNNFRADNDGHGTADASIIAAQPGKTRSFSGVAPEATIVPVKVANEEPQENADAAAIKAYKQSLAANLIKGISWAANNPSVDIIAIPIAGDSSASNDALKKATEDAIAKGKVVVAAAGNSENRRGGPSSPSVTSTSSSNSSENMRYPAGYEGVIGVTAADSQGNVNESVVHSDAVKLVAPGQNMIVANGATGICLTSTQAPSTSYATAYVAGVAALVKARHPRESGRMITYRLLSSANRASAASSSKERGWGFVNPYGAVTMVDDGQIPGPTSPVIQRLKPVPTVGSNVPPEPHDPQGNGRKAGIIWAGAGVGLTVVLLILAAGRSRMALRPREADDDADNAKG